MSYIDPSQSIRLDPLLLPVCKQHQISLHLLRLDLIHPLVSGNKWFKLRYNLQQAKVSGASSVISFGGAFSNHLHALAWAGKELGIRTVGVVRGEPEYAQNPTLSDAACWGMELKFVSRSEYRQRDDVLYHKALLDLYPGAVIVPEGGSNALAVKGFEDLFAHPCWQQVPKMDLLVSACGTGGTLAGLIAARPAAIDVLGIPVLKGADFLYADIEQLLIESGAGPAGDWQLDLDGHEGGYAKLSADLIQFMRDFSAETNIELDPVYTGKMMFRLHKLIAQGTFSAGTSIVAVHTGGLKGRRGFLARGLI